MGGGIYAEPFGKLPISLLDAFWVEVCGDLENCACEDAEIVHETSRNGIGNQVQGHDEVGKCSGGNGLCPERCMGALEAEPEDKSLSDAVNADDFEVRPDKLVGFFEFFHGDDGADVHAWNIKEGADECEETDIRGCGGFG